MRPKQKALLVSEIAGLVKKIPHLRIGHTQDLLGTVMLWLSDSETDSVLDSYEEQEFWID